MRPSGGGVFVTHAPKSSPLIGGRVARVGEELCRCGGTEGGVVLVFQGFDTATRTQDMYWSALQRAVCQR
jgi:hypothetical protein